MMVFIFILLLTILLYNIKFYNTNFYKDYLGKNNTTIINGYFIIIVFFSHFQQYVSITNTLDIVFYKFIGLVWQLMVTTFLFFSGYGIYERVKLKANDYTKNFFKKRFIPTYINWCIALILFLIVDYCLNYNLSIKQILLSFIGWESIGNSNWYMFDVFVLYIIFVLSFNLFKRNKYKIITMTIIMIIFTIALWICKDGYWYNTLLCFPLGMIYSYNKNKIDKIVTKNNKNYIIILSILMILFIVAFLAYHLLLRLLWSKLYIEIIFNIVSCIFVLLISVVLMKFELRSKLLYWCWKNLFWIYILQRIPMIIFKDKFDNYYYYFVICLISTVLFVLFINRIKKNIGTKLHIKNNNL